MENVGWTDMDQMITDLQCEWCSPTQTLATRPGAKPGQPASQYIAEIRYDRYSNLISAADCKTTGMSLKTAYTEATFARARIGRYRDDSDTVSTPS